MSAELYNWLVDPERHVLMDYSPEKEQIVISWHTPRGRIETCAETLDLAIKKAHQIDQNTDPERRIRLAYMPTAHYEAWSTGCRPDGKYGWCGFIHINAKMPKNVEFELPKLPRGWVYEEFFTNIRRCKSKRIAYIEARGENSARFSFRIKAEQKTWSKGNPQLFSSLCETIGEIERAHFVIDPVWS